MENFVHKTLYTVTYEPNPGKRVLSHPGFNIFNFFLELVFTIQFFHNWEWMIFSQSIIQSDIIRASYKDI